jgi:hypothetical protein
LCFYFNDEIGNLMFALQIKTILQQIFLYYALQILFQKYWSVIFFHNLHL